MSIPESHFSDEELWCHHCQKLILHPGFREALEKLRVAFGRPMTTRSVCRCKEYNDSPAVGGHPRSLHVCDHAQYPGQQGTLAADIAAVDGAYRGALFFTAWGLGWSIGWNAAKGFLHLDRRDWVGLPQAAFDYK